jgi:hypothetical protein
MYMHINDKDGSSSKRKDLALKASQEKKGKAKLHVEEESSSDDDCRYPGSGVPLTTV